jgi:hypothetical protein
MKKVFILHFIFSILLSACGNANALPVPTATLAPSATATIAIAPTPKDTATPKATATPEVAQFEVCTIEKYKDCVIPAEALLDGSYKEWLETLPPTKFDPAKVHDVQLVHFDNGWIIYQPKNAPNFTGSNEGREPFNRDRTFGFTMYQGNNYLVMPIEYYDDDNIDKNQWVLTVNNITGQSDTQIQANIQIWRNQMNTTAWVDSNILFYNPNPDPLVGKTMEKYPNLLDLINQFVDLGNNGPQDGNRAALDLPGLVFLNFIGPNDGHWLE